MKTLIALGIPIWVGTAIGASVDQAVPRFWCVWTAIGIVLAVTTTIYIYNRRPE